MKELLKSYCECKKNIDARIEQLEEERKDPEKKTVDGANYRSRIFYLKAESKELGDAIVEIQSRL